MYLVISNKLNNELKKSLGNNSKLDYFKNKLLAILDKKEKEEEKEFHKSWDDIELMQKSRAMPVGTIQTWKGKKFKKMPNKKWVRVYDTRNRSAEISIARLKGKVRRATSVDELFEIVSNNIHRFEDENGRTLDIVQELKAEVDKVKGGINKERKEAIEWDKAYNPILQKVAKFVKENKIDIYSKLPSSDISPTAERKYYELAENAENGKRFDLGNTSTKTLEAIMQFIEMKKIYNAKNFYRISRLDYRKLRQFIDFGKQLLLMEDVVKHAKNWKGNKEINGLDKVNKTYNNIDYNSLPDEFKTEETKETFTNLCKFLNTVEIKDERIKAIFKNFGKITTTTMYGYNRSVNILLDDDDEGDHYNCNFNNTVSIPQLHNTKQTNRIKTIIHEFTHRIDGLLSIMFDLDQNTKVLPYFKGKILKELPPKIKDYLDKNRPKYKDNSEYDKKYTEFLTEKREEAVKKWPNYITNPYQAKKFKEFIDYYNENFTKITGVHSRVLDDEANKGKVETRSLCDIYDAMSGGKFFDDKKVFCGHGHSYFKDVIMRPIECIADYIPIKILHPEQVDLLRENSPEIYNFLEERLDKIMNRINVYYNKDNKE